jgi:uncharacterized protein (DUF3084 family)
LSKPTETPEN